MKCKNDAWFQKSLFLFTLLFLFLSGGYSQAEDPKPSIGNEIREKAIAANEARIKANPPQKPIEKPKVPEGSVEVAQFFFTHGVNENNSPKEVIKDAVFPERSPILQFSVLLRGKLWPTCFFMNLYRDETSIGSVYHCHTPLQKELKEGVGYIATQPYAPSRLRPSEHYRVELYADDRLLGIYPFKVAPSENTTEENPKKI